MADYDLINRGQDVVWWHPDGLHVRIADDGPYGLHDIRAIGALKRALPIVWYSETMIVRKMRYPRFKLDVDFLGRLHARQTLFKTNGPLTIHTWERVSRPVLRAARAVAAREGVTFVIVARRTRDRLGAGEIEAFVLHADTKWRPKALIKAAGRDARVYVVSGAGAQPHERGAFNMAAAHAACAAQSARAEPTAS